LRKKKSSYCGIGIFKTADNYFYPLQRIYFRAVDDIKYTFPYDFLATFVDCPEGNRLVLQVGNHPISFHPMPFA